MFFYMACGRTSPDHDIHELEVLANDAHHLFEILKEDGWEQNQVLSYVAVGPEHYRDLWHRHQRLEIERYDVGTRMAIRQMIALMAECRKDAHEIQMGKAVVDVEDLID